MRFGRNLHKHQVLEWEHHYIGYDHLKRLLRDVGTDTTSSSLEADLHGLAIAIKDDLDRVQAFFLRQYMFIESKLDSLCVAYSFSTTDVSRFREEIISLGPHRANNLLWALIAIFRSYEKLRWYAAVNAHGLRRILAKFSARGFVLNDIPQLDGSPGTSRGFLSYAACSRDLQTLAALIDNFKSLYPTLCHVVPHEHCLEGTFTHEKCLEGIPPLVYAMQTGDLNDIRTMLERPRNLQRELDRGRTALHVAAREGRHDLLRLILESNGQLLNVINVPEPQLGLTPLMIGCIHGHLEVIKQLLAYHVDHTAVDSRGWTAKEHAAFRGHLDVARMLPTATRVDRDDRSHPSLDPYPSDELPIALEKASGELDQNQIILTLGPANTRDPSKPVELHQVLFPPYNLYPDAGFSLVIVPINAKGERFITRLPLLHNTTNDPWTLRTADPETVQLTFHLHQETGRTTKHVATGVFDFSSQKQRDSTGKEGLMRDRSVSMLATDLKSVAATVTFSYLVARPYKGRTSKADPEISHGFWNTGGPTNVVGHRGSGANTTSRTNLQLGENTVDSLASACDLGASGVEFDVQLTKDLVPVIYHNFLVMETGGETTIWNLNEDQFINLSESQASAGALTNMPEVRYRSRNGESSIRPRSHSMDLYDDHRITDMVDRMKRTAEGKSRGIKGNLRGHAIQSMFPKFIELLTRLPESVAFDVEMKYPMLWEAQDQGWDPSTIDANLFVDTILDLIYEYGGRRNITFSSFSPEICILLKAKQKDYPILFISKAGSVPVGDVRASSMQDAVHFAKRWGLAGIVLQSAPIVMCPRLIAYARSAGLICASYGDLNDDPENAKIQADAGLDTLIVNKVKLISQTLANRQ